MAREHILLHLVQARAIRSIGVLLIMAGAPCAAAWAQQQPAKAEPALKGPEVTDRNVPGAAPDFGMGVNRRFADRVPPEAFRKALSVLLADDAPAAIRATDQQRAAFRELVDGFEAKVREFRREHAKEIDALRREAGLAPGERPRAARDAGAPAQDVSPEDRKKREAAAAKFRELTAQSPKIEDVYTKVWMELSEPQRRAVQSKIDEWRDEQVKKREEDYVRRQRGKKAQSPSPPPSSSPAPAPAQALKSPAREGAGDDEMMRPDSSVPSRQGAGAARAAAGDRTDARKGVAERRQRLLRLFERLTPDQQELLLRRLEERMQQGERARPGARQPGSETSTPAKPPANPDRVKVPQPEGGNK